MQVFPENLPTDTEQRLRLCESILTTWFEGSIESAGFPPSLVAAAEQRLGFALPLALRTFYLRLAQHPAWRLQDTVVPPGQLQLTQGALIVFREAQDVVDWSILLGDDVAPDPPVYLTNREVSPARRIEASSVSGFLVQMATLLVKLSPRESFRANGPATDEAVLALHDELAWLPQPKLHWPANTIHLGEENLIVEINDDDWIWVSALSPDAFRRACDICQEHGVSWEHIERADGSDGV